MNLTNLIILVVVLLVLEGLILALVFSRGSQNRKFYVQFGTEYDHTVEIIKDERKAQTELEERQQRMKNFIFYPLSVVKSKKVLLSKGCENLLRHPL